MLKKTGLSLAIAATISLTACGGGASSGSPSAADNNTDSNQTTTVSGRAADGYLAQARVFIDLNGNGALDSDEPRTDTDGSGFFTLETPSVDAALIVEAIQNLTVDLDTNQPVPNAFTLRAPIVADNAEQFVSPITTMVLNEMDDGQSLEQAKQTVADRLGTTLDPMDDFLAAKESTDQSVADNAERLHRIAQVTARIAAQVESQTTQSDLDALGLTKAELIELINQQIETLLPALLIDIDGSLADGTFDPDLVVENGDYEVTPPTTENPGPIDPPEEFPELDQRIANATADSPFLDWSTGSPQGNGEGSANYLKFESATNGQFIYDGIQQEVLFGSEDSATVSSREFFPRLDSTGITTEIGFISSDNSNVFLYQNGEFTGETVEDNLIGFREVGSVKGNFSGFEPSEKGTEVSSAYNSKITTEAVYETIDLSGISIRNTLMQFYPELAGTLANETDPAVFSEGSTAYLREEVFGNDIFMVDWRGGLGFSGCDSSYSYLELQSCNTVYGAGTDGNIDNPLPATTLDDLLYPTSTPSDQLYGTIGFENNGTDYYMALYGSTAEGSGEIRIWKAGVSGPNGEIPSPVATGTWELFERPFTHLKMNMPDGFYFRAFQKERGDLDYNSYPFLTEFRDFVRAGRFAQVGTNVTEFFRRDSSAPLLNNQARDEVLAKLNEWRLLTGHPGWEDTGQPIK
ncbi:hypothetical protein [Marinobacter sp.]|uniref:hypothetical protein n=1 Tax=Marinobacter sp. TaxID=50741 RepID=UPI002B270A47|nr:hypothetical protein [Marinobacter sp.]